MKIWDYIDCFDTEKGAFKTQIPLLNPIVEMLGFTGDYTDYSAIINKTVTYGGESFTINNVVCYDNNIIIGYSAKSNKKIDYSAKNHDNQFSSFVVLNDNGNELREGSSNGKSSDDGSNYTSSYSKINIDAKYLAFIPYVSHGSGYSYKDKNGKEVTVENPDPYAAKDNLVPINTKLPIEVSEGNNGKVALNKIAISDGKATIQGIIEGKLPERQTVYLEGDNPKADIRTLKSGFQT
jgi:hypothetical protein